MMKKPIVNTVVQVLGKVVMIGVSLLTTGLLTRGLGVEGYGNYILITSVFVLIDSLADFGTRIIGIKEAAGAESENEKRRIWVQIMWLRLLLTGSAFVAGLGLVFFWRGFSGIRLEAGVALLMIWFTSVAGSIEVVWQTRMQMWVKVLAETIFPVMFLGLLYSVSGPLNLFLVFGCVLVSRAISLALGLKAVFFVIDRKQIKPIDFGFVKKMFILAWPMGLYLLIFSSYDRAVDSMMIERMVGVREVAWYGLSYKIYSTLLQPAYFFVGSIFPLLSGKSVAGGKKRLVGVSLGLLVLGAGVVITSVYFLAPWIVAVLAGSEYGESAVILRYLLGAVFFSYLGHLAGFTLISRGKQKTMLVFGVIVLVFNVVANLVAIPRFGVYGAAGVTVMTEALGSILMIGTLVISNR
ncbi:MAG: oligosaccharide flippase family protein [Candidatus Shapirobacteria bacterium]|jgi:O-antigen/teichoic acid export membrane protein